MKTQGGTQRHKFFSQDWTFTIPAKCVSTPVQVATENEPGEICHILITIYKANELWRMLQGIETRKRNSPGEYTSRHQWRLKKQRGSTCRTSLTWLQQEGLAPLSVDVLNTTIKARETIKVGSIEDSLVPRLTCEEVSLVKLPPSTCAFARKPMVQWLPLWFPPNGQVRHIRDGTGDQLGDEGYEFWSSRFHTEGFGGSSEALPLGDPHVRTVCRSWGNQQTRIPHSVCGVTAFEVQASACGIGSASSVCHDVRKRHCQTGTVLT